MFLIYFGVNGTNCTYELTSKRNREQIYVGTVQHCLGAVMIDFQFSKGGRRGGAEHNSFLIECYVRHVGRGLVIEQIDLNNVMLYRQPQRHCKNAVIKQVLVTPFGFTKTCFVLVWYSKGPPKTCPPKLFVLVFF